MVSEIVKTNVKKPGPVTGLWPYIRNARWAAIATAPLIYACIVPFALLDLGISVYQSVCFPIYGIPQVGRRAYMKFDRARLRYLNLLERFNCLYCSYANGVLAYTREVAARTEQHWCPIRHAHDPQNPHDRYGRFLAYRDEAAYRERGETVRRDFSDLR